MKVPTLGEVYYDLKTLADEFEEVSCQAVHGLFPFARPRLFSMTLT